VKEGKERLREADWRRSRRSCDTLSHRHPCLALSGSLRFLLAWSRSSGMTDGASPSASDLRCTNARGPQKALHLDQFWMPCTGCCFSHHCVLAVIMPECTGGVAPPDLSNGLITARTAPGLGRVSLILVVLAVGHATKTE